MKSTLRYVIVTPVRDEEQYIERTICSVLSQTVRPAQWIIVDDGSRDGTGRIIDRYAMSHGWITAVHRPSQAPRAPGAKVIEAFYAGYKAISVRSWDLIVKLDCDLSFGADYFALLLGRFTEDGKLGIASGVYLEKDKAGIWHEIQMPSYHAAGACKVMRRACFEEIGGFIASAGWDTVDEIRAMGRGWKTGHFRELQMKHHKPEGTGIGLVRTSTMHGEIYYRTGGSLLFFILKVLKRAGAKPYLAGALAMAWGYCRARVLHKDALVTRAEGRHYQALLHHRLRTQAKNLLKNMTTAGLG